MANGEYSAMIMQFVHRLLFIVHRIFFYLTNNSSLYFGSVHIWLSTISSSLSMW